MSCYFCDASRIESIHDFQHHGFPNKTIGAMTLMRHYDGEPMVKVELDTDVTLDIRVDGSFRGCEDVSVTATGFIEGVNFCPFCGGKAEFTNGGYWGRELFKVKCSNKDKCVMLPETGAYFIKQQAAAAWNTRSDNA